VRVHGDARAIIDVVDHGPGIPAAERAQVFTAFYRRTDARTRSTPGHGVGLALIAHVAGAHGGTAELLDAPRGAHLRITLPRWS
jgi:signal transduction histidine kinase